MKTLTAQSNKVADFEDASMNVYCLCCKKYYPQTKAHWIFSQNAEDRFLTCRYTKSDKALPQRIPYEDEVPVADYQALYSEAFRQ